MRGRSARRPPETKRANTAAIRKIPAEERDALSDDETPDGILGDVQRRNPSARCAAEGYR